MKSGFGFFISEHLAGLDCWKMTALLSSEMRAVLKHDEADASLVLTCSLLMAANSETGWVQAESGSARI